MYAWFSFVDLIVCFITIVWKRWLNCLIFGSIVCWISEQCYNILVFSGFCNVLLSDAASNLAFGIWQCTL